MDIALCAVSGCWRSSATCLPTSSGTVGRPWDGIAGKATGKDDGISFAGGVKDSGGRVAEAIPYPDTLMGARSGPSRPKSCPTPAERAVEANAPGFDRPLSCCRSFLPRHRGEL